MLRKSLQRYRVALQIISANLAAFKRGYRLFKIYIKYIVMYLWSNIFWVYISFLPLKINLLNIYNFWQIFIQLGGWCYEWLWLFMTIIRVNTQFFLVLGFFILIIIFLV